MDSPRPLGTCWCGCGRETTPSAFFVSGHDKVAEAAVVRAEYGSVAEFLAAHGYGPGQRNPRHTYDARQEQPVASAEIEVRYRGGVQYDNRDVLEPAPRLIVYRDGQYWCPIDALLSGIAYHTVVLQALDDEPEALRGELARFAALRVEDAVRAGVLPHEQTDRVQRIGVSIDNSPSQGVNFVVSADDFIEYVREGNRGAPALVEGSVLHHFTVEW